MRRIAHACCATLALALPAANAQAAPTVVPTTAPNACLRGLTDGVASVPVGVLARAVELRRPDLSQAPPVAVGPMAGCPAVAGAVDGPIAVAAQIGGAAAGDGDPVAATFRDGPAAASLLAELGPGTAPAVAINEAGEGIVVWARVRVAEPRTPGSSGSEARLYAARRAPGAPLAPAVRLTGWVRMGDAEPEVAAGIDGAGVSTVAWRDRDTLRVTSAPAGAAFAAAVAVAHPPGSSSRFALAVARDGTRALAYAGERGVRVHDAPPGGTFGPARRVGAGAASDVALTLRDGGGAAVAWRSSPHRPVQGVQVAARAVSGSFSTARRLDRPEGRYREDSFAGLGAFVRAYAFMSAPREFESAPRLALGAGGHVGVTWEHVGCACAGDDALPVARFAAGTLDGELGPARTLGGMLRPSAGAVPLPGGGAAFSDSDGGWAATGTEVPFGAGRIGIESPGAVAAPAAPTRLRARVPAQAVRRRAPLRARVRCDQACDVRAIVRGAGWPLAVGTRTLAAGVEATVRLWPRGRRLPRRPLVIVRAAAPAAPGGVAERRVKATIRLRPAAPRPRIVAPSVRRVGDDIDVSYRTTAPVVGAFASVRAGRVLAHLPSAGRTRFHVLVPAVAPGRTITLRLTPVGAGRSRLVRLRAPA